MIQLLIFAFDQLRSHLDNRHLTPKAAEHLSELQPDVTSSDDHQMPRKKIDVHHGGVGQVRNLIDSGHVGDLGAPAHVDKNLGSSEAIVADADLCRGFEPRVAHIDRNVAIAAQP